ncbi:hypothetical protein TELCIR_12989, partial [Teladorsagia circumcincta]
LGMRALTRLRPDLLGQRKILKPKPREVYVSHGDDEVPTALSFEIPLCAIMLFILPVFVPLSATQIEPVQVVEMPTPVCFPVPLIDENSRYEDSLGRRCWTTHGVFDNCSKQVDPELSLKLQLLKEKFFPVEFDPKLTLEQKVPFMEEWQ